MTPRAQGIAWMVASCVWASLLVSIVRYLSFSMHPFEMVFMRNLIALCLFIPWLMRSGMATLRTDKIRLYGFRGMVGYCAMLSWFTSLSLVPLPQAISLSFMAPLFTTLGAVLFFHEKCGLRRALALLAGFTGALIIVRPGMAGFQVESLLVLVAAFFWAFSGLIVKKLTATEKPKVIVFYMQLVITPLSLPLALSVWVTPSAEQIMWLVLLGIVSNQMQIALANAFSKADVATVMPFDYLRLVFVSAIAYVVFDEVIDMWTLAGSLVILGSTVYTAHRERVLHRRTLEQSKQFLQQ